MKYAFIAFYLRCVQENCVNEKEVCFHVSLPKRSNQWLSALNLTKESTKEHHRVCSRHFPSGDVSQTQSLNIGARFASPKKMQSAGGVRAISFSAKRRQPMSVSCGIKRPVNSPSVNPSPTPSTVTHASSDDPCLDAATLYTPVGEPLLCDYSVDELPSENGDTFLSSSEAPLPADVNVTHKCHSYCTS